MAQFPCLPLWTDAWVADTAHLSRLKEGTYWRLLVLMWRTPGCRVPNSDEWLAERMRMTLGEVAAELRPIIAEFCQNDGNWIHQKRLEREFVKRFEFGRAQSVRRKGKKNKKKELNPDITANGKPPSLPLTPKEEPSLKRIDPAEPKQAAAEKEPAEMTLSELNKRWRGT